MIGPLPPPAVSEYLVLTWSGFFGEWRIAGVHTTLPTARGQRTRTKNRPCRIVRVTAVEEVT